MWGAEPHFTKGDILQSYLERQLDTSIVWLLSFLRAPFCFIVLSNDSIYAVGIRSVVLSSSHGLAFVLHALIYYCELL